MIILTVECEPVFIDRPERVVDSRAAGNSGARARVGLDMLCDKKKYRQKAPSGSLKEEW